ncbi:MAG: hypothetical protein PHO05_02520 [bacterium]|nr:hypothetical protein [bacterium]
MWHGGLLHYHTSFKYPVEYRVSPSGLAAELKQQGMSFVFCAGDHGDEAEGRGGYWGWGDEYPEYEDACAGACTSDFLLVPALEHHLRFPGKRRSEHHFCVPLLTAMDMALNPGAIPYAVVRVKHTAHVKGKRSSAVLNHPYLTRVCPFSGPSVEETAPLHNFDYLELFTIDWPGYFTHDFNTYLYLLSLPASSGIACCSGIDNGCEPFKPPSDDPRIPMNATFLYVHGNLTMSDLMSAWNDRRAYAVHGYIRIREIDPVPSLQPYRVKGKPLIKLHFHTLKSWEQKQMAKVCIYRNGCLTYAHEVRTDEDELVLEWIDEKATEKKAGYIIHVQMGNEHLVTSPITIIRE